MIKFKFIIFTVAALAWTQILDAAVLDLSSALVRASSQENATNTPIKAFDGITTTRWATATGQGDNSWIWVDLGADYSLQSVAIRWEAADATEYKLYSLSTAQASGIGFSGGTGTPTYASQWSQIASVVGAGDGSSNTIDTFNFNSNTVTTNSNRAGSSIGTTSISNQPTVRYLLINPIADSDVNGGASIFEVTVDGIATVPEPGSLFIVAGFAGILLLRRRR